MKKKLWKLFIIDLNEKITFSVIFRYLQYMATERQYKERE